MPKPNISSSIKTWTYWGGASNIVTPYEASWAMFTNQSKRGDECTDGKNDEDDESGISDVETSVGNQS